MSEHNKAQQWEDDDFSVDEAVVKVIGVGNGGCNAITNMKKNAMGGNSRMELIAMNTDAQSLSNIEADRRIVLGRRITGGRGAGTSPERGRQAAEADAENIKALLQGTSMLFLTTGMGGGTGTGATPVIAKIAREMGIYVIAIVTRPFAFELSQKMKTAEQGITALRPCTNSIIVISNEKLLTVVEKGSSMRENFAKADEVLLGSLRGLFDILYKKGLQNLDFADVKAVLEKEGMAIIGTGTSKGSNRAKEATEMAIRNPLFDDFNLKGAGGALINIVGKFGPHEVKAVTEVLQGSIDADKTLVKLGYVEEDLAEDALQVTVIMTGLEYAKKSTEQEAKAQASSGDIRLRPVAGAVAQRPLLQRHQRAAAALAEEKDREWIGGNAD